MKKTLKIDRIFGSKILIIFRLFDCSNFESISS